jgi:hypothetical protein
MMYLKGLGVLPQETKLVYSNTISHQPYDISHQQPIIHSCQIIHCALNSINTIVIIVLFKKVLYY